MKILASLKVYIAIAVCISIISIFIVSFKSKNNPEASYSMEHYLAGKDNGKLKQRIVCFKFKEAATHEQIETHMKSFADLKKKIPYIKSYSGGLAVSGDKGSQPEYNTLHYMTFKNFEDIELYFKHPAHKEFIEVNKGIWDEVLVINAYTE